MATQPEATPESSPPKLSPKSIIGVAFLLLLAVIASVRPEEEQPPWTRELPTRISPPLESPRSPTGPATLAGVVLSIEGAPVAGALVMTESGELLAWDYTDAKGRFTLEGLAETELLVRVIADDHQPQDFPLADPREEGRLQLTASFPEPPALPELVHIDITGVVKAPRADWDMEGYELWLEPLDPAQEFGAPLPARATIQGDRSFSFEGLLTGRYRAALLPPWATMGTWPNLLDRKTPILTVGLSQDPHYELESVAGEFEGTVIDEEGALVAHALVGVHPKDAHDQVWPPTHTDKHGHFTIRDLPVGTYLLHAHAGELSVEDELRMPGSLTLKVDLSLHR